MATILKLVCVKGLRGYARFAVLFFYNWNLNIKSWFGSSTSLFKANVLSNEGFIQQGNDLLHIIHPCALFMHASRPQVCFLQGHLYLYFLQINDVYTLFMYTSLCMQVHHDYPFKLIHVRTCKYTSVAHVCVLWKYTDLICTNPGCVAI